MVARIKREDLVEVIRGRDKGKRGTVQQILPAQGKALVEGLNMVKKHLKAGASGARQAGIISMEKPLAIFKIMPVCPSCDRPTRVGIRLLDDGSKARVCKRCDGMLA